MPGRTILLADGENLVMRYQSLLKAGHQPNKDVTHIANSVVWHPAITKGYFLDIIRVSYYTTQVGDEDALQRLEERISEIKYEFKNSPDGTPGVGRLCPHLFKKEKRSQKTKSVDINITIDALRHTYNDSADVLYLLAGDGDYLPLIQEIMRQGKQVYVAAFSDGLSSRLPHVADVFVLLDPYFFK